MDLKGKPERSFVKQFWRSEPTAPRVTLRQRLDSEGCDQTRLREEWDRLARTMDVFLGLLGICGANCAEDRDEGKGRGTDAVRVALRCVNHAFWALEQNANNFMSFPIRQLQRTAQQVPPLKSGTPTRRIRSTNATPR